MHAFFPLLLACFIVGMGIVLPVTDILSDIKDGFGSIMKSLGLIIVIGTVLGVVLEFTGSTEAMALYILRKVGDKKASLAMAITGVIVGLPIFCDSGYIVLSGLNRSISSRSTLPSVVLSVSMAVGLYSVHCLIPPHSGATAAASLLEIDMGRLIWTGILVAIPAMFAGYFWTLFSGRKEPKIYEKEAGVPKQMLPSALSAFLPVIIPIFLIALRSFMSIDSSMAAKWKIISICGDPVIALTIGVILAFLTRRKWKRNEVNKLFQNSAEKAGGIFLLFLLSFGKVCSLHFKT